MRGGGRLLHALEYRLDRVPIGEAVHCHKSSLPDPYIERHAIVLALAIVVVRGRVQSLVCPFVNVLGIHVFQALFILVIMNLWHVVGCFGCC